LLGIASVALPVVRAGAAPGGNDWPKYLGNNAGTGFTNETLITPANAAALALRPGWPVSAGGAISTQPVVSNGVVYWGSWDGREHATPLGGNGDLWNTYIGRNNAGPGYVVSTADVVNVSVPLAGTVPTLFVGGAGTNDIDQNFVSLYAINPANGSIRWHTPLALSQNHLMWSSPADYTYNGLLGRTTSVYVGISALGETNAQGQLVQLDAGTGIVQHVFNVVPFGCTGGSIWGSPTVDQSDGSIYVATGDDGSCLFGSEPYSTAVLKLRATDLTLLGAWKVPKGEQVGGTVTGNGDFGSAPTLFTGSVTPGGPLRNLVGVANKNGIFYVFDRSNLSQGPVARVQVANSSANPFAGGSISPASWDGQRVYVAGAGTTINGVTHLGSLRALDPNNLATPLWTLPVDDGPVLAPVTSAPGLAVVGAGAYTDVVRTSDGTIITKLPVSSLGTAKPAGIVGGASIAHGVIYQGDSNGVLYAYSVGGT
jgi:hypothetical protein